MSIDTNVNQITKFRDLGVVELTEERSLPRKRELVQVINRAYQEVFPNSGQIIVAGGITDRQKRHLVVFLNRARLRENITIERGFPYHNGQSLTNGTRILIKGRK